MIISSSTTVHRRSIVPRGAGGVPMNMISRSEGRKARRLRLAREMAASFDAVRGTRPGTAPPRSRNHTHTHTHTHNSGKPPGRLYRGKSGNKNASGASLFEEGKDLGLQMHAPSVHTYPPAPAPLGEAVPRGQVGDDSHHRRGAAAAAHTADGDTRGVVRPAAPGLSYTCPHVQSIS